MKLSRSRLSTLLQIGILLAITGCGGTETPATPDPGNPDGVLLPGNPGDNALQATYQLPTTPVPESEVDNGFIKTRLEAMISPTATVGEVNTALTENDARIISMTENSPFMVLKVVALASPTEARALGDQLIATGGFLAGMPGFVLTFESVSISSLGEPLAVLPPSGGRLMTYAKKAHMPAAWNARAAMSSQPTVYVPDGYSEFTNHPQLPDQVFTVGAGQAQQNDDGNHGFHVCGTIGALYDNALPTGVLPAEAGSMQMISLPESPNIPWLDVLKDIADHFPAASRFVMNTSLGYNDPNFARHSKATRALHAMYWRAQVSSSNNRFFHATSAGNDGATPGDGGLASFSSTFALNALFNDLRDVVAGESLSAADSTAVAESWKLLGQGSVQGQPQNVLVVGSSDTTGTESAFSSRNPDVRTVGEEVWSLCRYRVSGGSGSCDGNIAKSAGTSMATPQVAGLAAYIWSIDPNISIPRLKDIIQTAYDKGTTPGVVDAYMGVLAADNTLANAPAREAILDVAGSTDAPGSNNRFDDHDIKVFLDQFAAATPNVEDYSRYDLNGDGETGGGNAIKMDLTADPVPNFGTATTVIEGLQANLDETAVTDGCALCYYAYSSLYQGSPARRTELLGDCLALTTGGGGAATFVSANHLAAATAAVGDYPSCEPGTPCQDDDPFEESSVEWNFSSEGEVSAMCMSASDRRQVSMTSTTDAVGSDFSLINAIMSVRVIITGSENYGAGIFPNRSAQTSSRWVIEITGGNRVYSLDGNGTEAGTGTIGSLFVRLVEIANDNRIIRVLHEISEAGSWAELGVLTPGRYAFEVACNADGGVLCRADTEEQTATCTTSLVLTQP